MNFKRTLQILSKDIEEIENILGEIEISSPGSKMEMRLALSKLKNLQENFTLFAFALEETPPAPSPPPAPPQQETAPPAQEEEPETPGDTPENVPREEVVSSPATTDSPSASPAEEKTEEAAGKEPAKNKEKKSAPGNKGKKVLLSDTLQPQHANLNEQLAREHSAEDVSARLSKRAITDLRKIINVNERFMFIRDLFDGDKGRYEETIRFLNDATTREEAESFLSGFKWDKKSEAAQRFTGLVQRKLRSLQDG